MLSFGPYPLVSLAEPREQRDAARKLRLKGVDPAAQRRTDRREAELAGRRTFGQLAEEYIERMKERGAAEATIEKTTWLLNDLAAPLAKRPMSDIQPSVADARAKRLEAKKLLADGADPSLQRRVEKREAETAARRRGFCYPTVQHGSVRFSSSRRTRQK